MSTVVDIVSFHAFLADFNDDNELNYLQAKPKTNSVLQICKHGRRVLIFFNLVVIL